MDKSSLRNQFKLQAEKFFQTHTSAELAEIHSKMSKNLRIILAEHKVKRIAAYQPMKYELPMIDMLQTIDLIDRIEIFIPPREIENIGLISLADKMNPQAKLYPSAEMNAVIVPGLYIDKKGHRLGKGKGWYDQLLAKNSYTNADPQTPNARPTQTIFAGYSWQYIDLIPSEAHDIQIKHFVNENEILSFNA